MPRKVKKYKVIKEVIEKRIVKVKNGKNYAEDVRKIVYYKKDNGRIGLKTIALDKTKTLEDQGPETNINNIVSRLNPHDVFEKYVFDEDSDGIIDVPQYQLFEDALNMKRAAEEQFERLPSYQRSFFDNNYKKMVKYCDEAKTNENKMAELERIGLAKKLQNNAPDVDPVVSKLSEISNKLDKEKKDA
jgi:hypothetical protein